jgi:hypothetical protein
MSSIHDACQHRSTKRRELQRKSAVSLENFKPSEVRERPGFEFEDMRELFRLLQVCVVEILIDDRNDIVPHVA